LRGDRNARCPSSFEQERAYAVDCLRPGDVTLNLHKAVVVAGPLAEGSLREALATLAERHEILRTGLVQSDGALAQITQERIEPELTLKELTDVGGGDEGDEARARALAEAFVSRPFELRRAPLWRLLLVRLRPDRHVAVVCMHAAIADAETLQAFITELFQLHEVMAVADDRSPLGDPRQYRMHAEEQRALDEGLLASQEAYWVDALGDGPQLSGLPAFRLRGDRGPADASLYRCRIPADLLTAAENLALDTGRSSSEVLGAAFAVLLYRYGTAPEVTFGHTVSARRDEGSMGMGPYGNLGVLRLRVDEETSFTQMLERFAESLSEAKANGDYPLHRLARSVELFRDAPTGRLLPLLFSPELHLPPIVPDSQLGRLEIEEFETAPAGATHDVEVTARRDANGVVLDWVFDAHLHDRESIIRVAAHFVQLLGSALASADAPVARLDYLSAADEAAIRQRWNTVRTPYPEECVHRLVERQVERRPRATAVRFGGEDLSYEELNRRANAMARYLRRAGAAPGEMVGICLDRSAEMVVATLATLKAGCAVVPLDPAYPPERLALMLEDSGVGTVVLDRSAPLGAATAEELFAGLIEIDLDRAAIAIAAEAGDDLDDSLAADALAYCIFTSGSTGRPKCVMVEHRALANLVAWHREAWLSAAGTRTLLYSPFSFDVAFHEIFAGLCSGATLIQVDEATRRNPLAILEFARKERIEKWYMPYVTLQQVAQAARTSPPPESLKELIVGGEVLRITPEIRDLARRTGCVIHNHYGSTECIDVATCTLAGDPDEWPSVVPIGHACVANMNLYVLDPARQLVPIGVVGELFGEGDCLARGYRRSPELTKERFLASPFGVQGTRLYRLGDLGRYLPDGSIECLGRVDHQVKIRGFRVEPGEVEAILLEHPAVSECVVAARPGPQGRMRLIAYVVAADGYASAVLSEQLRTVASERLPDHMVPAAVVVLDAIPMTPSGKIAFRRLPPPPTATPSRSRHRGSELEKLLAGVWGEVLELPEIDPRRTFFELGGDSVLLVNAHQRTAAALGRELPVETLFRYPTIESLVEHLDQRSAGRPLTMAPSGTRRSAAVADQDVAIIGMACRVPGAANVAQFWANLRAGVESVAVLAEEEIVRLGSDQTRDPHFVPVAATIPDIDLFDAEFFGYSAAEAAIIDPQQRLFLECAWEAVEDAGLDLGGGAVGVYAGAGLGTYLVNNVLGAKLRSGPFLSHRHFEQATDLRIEQGNASDHLPTRVSFKLGLRGPSVNVQSTCSTSLVAVHLARQALLSGECEVALAGGVSVITPQNTGYVWREGMMLSPDGHCRAFDADAAGTVFGNGLGAVVLKPLAAARADGDRVYAVLKGSAVNNDGADKLSYSGPSVEAQAEVIARAHESAGVGGDDVSYVEAHGTGTKLGDPIELAGLRQAFAHTARGERARCAIGSVKTNVGHLDEAAGVIGLIKTALSLRHREIPPSLNFTSPNSMAELEGDRFFVNTELREWDVSAGRRRVAGVSSFGMGGTNCHVVLEEAPEPDRGSPISADRPLHVLPISARSTKALRESAHRYLDRLAGIDDREFADLCFSAAIGRRHFERRLAIPAADAAGAISGLEAILVASDLGEVAPRVGDRRPGVTFLFTGQGSQYAGMGRTLYEAQPVYREAIEQCDEILRPMLDSSLASHLYGTDAGASIDGTAIAQPALFAVGYALARLWGTWGIEPDCLLGHSIGEHAAACLAGVFTLEDGLTLVATRGRLMQELPAGGAMAQIEASAEALAPYLARVEDQVSLASINSPTTAVISGDAVALSEVCGRLGEAGIDSIPLNVSHAFHSPLMEPMLEEFRAVAEEVTYSEPQIDLISSVTGELVGGGQIATADYWVRQIMEPVQFDQAMRAADSPTTRAFVEIGPKPTLIALGRSRPGAERFQWIPSLTPRDQNAAITGLGELYRAGVSIDWAGFDAQFRRRRVSVPAYPFQRERHWLEPDQDSRAGESDAPAITERGGVETLEQVWEPMLRPVGSGAGGRLHLVVGVGSPATELARDLSEAGASCQLVSDVAGLDEPLRGQSEPRVILVPDPSPSVPILDATAALVGDVRRILERLVDIPGSSLLLVAQMSEPGVPVAASELGLCGTAALVRSIAAEHPDLACASLTVPSALSDGDLGPVVDLLTSDTVVGGEQLAIRDGQLERARLRPRPVRQGAVAELPIREDGTYLITGGTGGVGLRLALEIARHRPKRLVLTSRSGTPADQDASIWEELQAAGTHVSTLAVDVCDATRMRRTLSDCGPDLRGVFHCAGVLDDGILLRQTDERLAAVLRPKVEGAWLLHRLTQELAPDLDLFVLFSSMASLLGYGGQSAYAVANGFIDGLARYRHRSGLPGVSVSWGSWAGAGMTARMCERGSAKLGQDGERPLAAAEAIAALAELVAAQVPHSMVTEVDWKAFAAERPRPPAMIESLTGPIEARVAPRDPGFRAGLRKAAPEEARATLREAVAATVEGLLGNAGGRLDPIRGFEDLGIDSLGALDLRGRLQVRLGLSLPATFAFEQPSLEALVGHLEESYFAADIAATPAPPENTARARVGRSPLPAPTEGAAEGDAVAVVGMSCRFPASSSPEEFWAMLQEGRDGLVDVPSERWGASDLYDPDPEAPGKMYVRRAALIRDVDCFDPGFFGISPREAASMDPRHRLLLEESWSAIEAAGIDPTALRGSDTGVYLGGDEFANNYLRQASAELGSESYLATGTTLSFAAGRLSYKLGLHGPSMVIATSCSSSLVALHTAVGAIRRRECGMAIVGGAALLLGPEDTMQLCKLRALAPDGRSKAFSSEADGYGRGEGAGAVLLKPLRRAEADGDPILAVIRGTAVNHDGPSSGLTVPSLESQVSLIARALVDARLEPSDVDYLETHGTGTQLGDPIELRALGKAFAGRPAPLLLGSVKANIGHLEEVAGLAGLIKVVLALGHGSIPPQIHCDTLNQKVEWEELPVRVQRTALPWPSDGARVAAVSSFGMSGTNAHIVLEAAAAPIAPPPAAGPFIFPFSARDEEDLDALLRRFVAALAASEDPSRIAATLQLGRPLHRHRVAIVAADVESLRRRLSAALDGSSEDDAAVVRGEASDGPSEPVDAPRLAADGRHADLARRWCEGAEVDWRALFDLVPMRLPLPTYPFKRERLWVGKGWAGQVPGQEPEVAVEPPAAPAESPEPATAAVLEKVHAKVAELLGAPPSDVPISVDFEDLGADSLTFMRLSRFLRDDFKVAVAFQELVEDAGTVASLATLVASRGGAAVPAPVPDSAPVADLAAGRELRSGPASLGGSLDGRETPSDRQARFVERLVADYAERTSGSKAAAERDRSVMANCRMPAFQQLFKEIAYPIVGERSKGSCFWDIDGNEYLDISIGYGVHFFGHSPEFVTAALRDQLDKGMHIGPQASQAGEVARLLCELTGMSRTVLCSSGTEAMMAALRFARAATGRSRFVMFEGAYHGWSDNTLALPAGPSGSVPMARGIGAGAMEDVVVVEYGSQEALETIRQLGPELAAVLVEPVQSRRPDLQPVGFLRELRALTRESGTALVFDEVITGFRVHPGGAQALFGVEADLAAYGKILGAGLPIGAVAGSARFIDTVDGGAWSYGDDSSPQVPTTFFGGTFNKNPMSMAAAHAVLSRLKQEGPALQERLAQRAAWLEEDFNTFCQTHGFPMRVVRFGPLFRFIGEDDYSLHRYPMAIELFFQMLTTKGIYVLESRVCFLSASHTEEEVQRIAETAKQCLVELREGGFFPTASSGAPDSTPSPVVPVGQPVAGRLVEDARIELTVPPGVTSPAPAGDVLLTGATGFLGAHLAVDLLRGTDARIHCLVRAEGSDEARSRLIDNLIASGRWEDRWEDRVVVVPGDLASPGLGLGERAWRHLAERIGAIFHNGAQVHSLLPYDRLRSANVEATRALLRLAVEGRPKAFHHVSSDAVFEAYGYMRQSTIYEDEPLAHGETVYGGGYAETKWVADKMVTNAREAGLPVSIYRPGTIVGALEGGAAPVDDFFARFIRGNLQLGIWPEIEAIIDFTPVDVVSQMIVELSRSPSIARTFHLTHPEPISYVDFVEAIRAAGHQFELVPFRVWEAAMNDLRFEDDNALYPLLPLFTESSDPLFRLARLDVREASAGAPESTSSLPSIRELIAMVRLDRFADDGDRDESLRGSPAQAAS
jgi:amino acid adenylation domain-containing protein/thioester reductase-like protein